MEFVAVQPTETNPATVSYKEVPTFVSLKVNYDINEGMLTEMSFLDRELTIKKAYRGEGLEEEYKTTHIFNYEKIHEEQVLKAPDGIEFLGYKMYEIYDSEGLLEPYTKTLSVGDLISPPYSKTTEVDEGIGISVETFIIGGIEWIQIFSDRYFKDYFKILRRDEISGEMVQQITIKNTSQSEFGFEVLDQRRQERRNITIGELRELYNTLKFMEDIRASSKDCNGGKNYEDLSFFCRAFFSLYPNYLNNQEDDQTEISYGRFPGLRKILIFNDMIYCSKDCKESRERLGEKLFKKEDIVEFRVVRLTNFCRGHSLLGIIPRDETKKPLIFDSAYATSTKVKDIADAANGFNETEFMRPLLMDPANAKDRMVQTSGKARCGLTESLDGAVFLNTFPIQQNGTCWAWSMAAGLAALEYDTYDDIVRAASTMARLGVDEFTEEAIKKLEGITDTKLAMMPEEKILGIAGLASQEDYVAPEPFRVAVGRFGQALYLAPQASRLHSLPGKLMEETTPANQVISSAQPTAQEERSETPVPQNKWITLYHQQAGREEENSMVR